MIIRLENLRKVYNKGLSSEQVVLNGYSFFAKEGEMIAIKGKSGVGKSTLLHIIGLTDTFDEGTYMLMNEDITLKSEKQLAKERNKTFGYIMQDFALISHMSVFDNIAIPLYLANNKFSEIKSRVSDVLRVVNLEQMLNKKVNQLSGGQKQRVAIARAIINKPKIILADEPTGALDTKTGKEIMKVFQDLNNMGHTIIIVTHDDSIANLCNKIINLGE